MAKRSSGKVRSAGVEAMTVAELHAELRKREGVVGKLMRRRERLMQSLSQLDQEIAAHGGRVAPSGAVVGFGRKRPKNEHKLVDALRELLTDKTMTVTEAAEAVQTAGYQTTSSSFRTIVNQTLINSGAFKRVGRGQYTAK